MDKAVAKNYNINAPLVCWSIEGKRHNIGNSTFSGKKTRLIFLKTKTGN
jgi:hypothetical protein